MGKVEIWDYIDDGGRVGWVLGKFFIFYLEKIKLERLFYE